jgi:AraC family transcriptional regulator
MESSGGGSIIRVSAPTEVLGGAQPSISSSESKFDGVLIERFTTEDFGQSSKYCFNDRHVISVQREGIAKARVNGSSKIWGAGAIAICPIGELQHEFTFSKVSVTCATLDPVFIREAVADAIDADRLELRTLRLERDEQLERLLLAAEFEIRSTEPGNRLLLESLGTAIAANLLVHHSSKRVVPREYSGTMPKHLLARAIDFIQENLGRNVSLAEISAEVDISPYHFCRSFKRETGFSPHQYLTRERVRRAQQFLTEHRLSLVEIANELGFSDQSHFTRIFHNLVGVTPARYAAIH